LVPAKRDDGKDFTFFDLLWLMIDASHNHATSKCIRAIGYLYINSLLWQTGLFAPGRNGGMWIGWNYWSRKEPDGSIDPGGQWYPPPIADPPRRTPDGQVIMAATSAASHVAFMSLLYQGKLVNKEACRRMKIFLDRRSDDPTRRRRSADRSPFGSRLRDRDGVADYTDALEELYAKIGLGERTRNAHYLKDDDGKLLKAKNVWDVALIVRKRGGKTLHYAAACLDSDTERPLRLITDALDDCIFKKT
jgi:hypothetical protein